MGHDSPCNRLEIVEKAHEELRKDHDALKADVKELVTKMTEGVEEIRSALLGDFGSAGFVHEQRDLQRRFSAFELRVATNDAEVKALSAGLDSRIEVRMKDLKDDVKLINRGYFMALGGSAVVGFLIRHLWK